MKLRRKGRSRQQLADKRVELGTLVAATRYRRGEGCHVTVYGGYHLALARNIGHASCTVTARMVGGPNVQGKLEDKHTVVSFEHKLAAAFAARPFAAMGTVNADTDIDAHEKKCDATNPYDIGKEKTHVSILTTSAVSASAVQLIETYGQQVPLRQVAVGMRHHRQDHGRPAARGKGYS